MVMRDYFKNPLFSVYSVYSVVRIAVFRINVTQRDVR
jgi:hypothetical protein